MALPEQALGATSMARGALGAAAHRAQRGLPRRLGELAGAGFRKSIGGSGEPGLDLTQLLLELAHPLAGGAGLGADVKRQRPELSPQRLEAGLELAPAIGEGRGAQRQALLLAAQLGEQAPGLSPLAVARGEALLGGTAALTDLGKALVEPGALGARPFRCFLRGKGAVLAETQILGDEPTAQLQLVLFDPQAELGRLRLALQRPQPGTRLALQVERPIEVATGRAQFQLGATAALAVLAEPRRLLDQHPPVARLGVDDRLDPALADHRVHLTAQVGVGEDLEHV